MNQNNRMGKVLIVIGVVFFIYAFLGNYVALPGYIRFMERGRTSVGGNSSDTSVLIGAAKTITWMFSFQLGVIFTLLGVTQVRGISKSTRWWIVGGSLLWLIIAGVPNIPGPFRWFYALGGATVLILIFLTILYWSKVQENIVSNNNIPAILRLIGYSFFALASWDVCGLGTTGFMLHPEKAVEYGTEPLLITQTTKIMLEFLFAWVFTFVSHFKEAKAN